MWTWRNIANLQVFKTLTLKKGALLNVEVINSSGSKVVRGISGNELVNSLDSGGRLVTHVAASTLTPALHANGVVNLLSLLAGFDTTLPAATGTGDRYLFHIGIVNTTNDYGILAATTDTLDGLVTIGDTDTTDLCECFVADGTDDKIEINGTTKGGLTIGDWVEFLDAGTGQWHVKGQLSGSNTLVTPFAAT
jgi:hypothetical protein